MQNMMLNFLDEWLHPASPYKIIITVTRFGGIVRPGQNLWPPILKKLRKLSAGDGTVKTVHWSFSFLVLLYLPEVINLRNVLGYDVSEK